MGKIVLLSEGVRKAFLSMTHTKRSDKNIFIYSSVCINAKFDKIGQNSIKVQENNILGVGENSSHIAHMKGWLSYIKCSYKSTGKKLNKKMGKDLKVHRKGSCI